MDERGSLIITVENICCDDASIEKIDDTAQDYMDKFSLRDHDLPEDTPILKKPYTRQRLLQLISEKLASNK